MSSLNAYTNYACGLCFKSFAITNLVLNLKMALANSYLIWHTLIQVFWKVTTHFMSLSWKLNGNFGDATLKIKRWFCKTHLSRNLMTQHHSLIQWDLLLLTCCGLWQKCRAWYSILEWFYETKCLIFQKTRLWFACLS